MPKAAFLEASGLNCVFLKVYCKLDVYPYFKDDFYVLSIKGLLVIFLFSSRVRG